MLIFEVKYLIGVLIGIDIIVFIFLLMLLRRFNDIKKNPLLKKEIKTFESLIKDTDEMAAQFNEQLKGKLQFIKKLNKKLDKRIGSLNLLLNRSDIVISDFAIKSDSDNRNENNHRSRRDEILKLAMRGQQIEEIAQKLSIPRGEVMLTLNMSRKVSG